MGGKRRPSVKEIVAEISGWKILSRKTEEKKIIIGEKMYGEKNEEKIFMSKNRWEKGVCENRCNGKIGEKNLKLEND